MNTQEQIKTLRRLAEAVKEKNDKGRGGFMCSILNDFFNLPSYKDEREAIINLLWETRLKTKVRENRLHTENSTRPYVWYSQDSNKVSNKHRLQNINRAVKN